MSTPTHNELVEGAKGLLKQFCSSVVNHPKALEAYEIMLKLCDHYPQYVIDILKPLGEIDWLNLNLHEIFSVFVMQDKSGSLEGYEPFTAKSLNVTFTKLGGNGDLVNATLGTLVLFDYKPEVVSDTRGILETPVVQVDADELQEGQILYVAEGGTNLLAAYVGGMVHRFAMSFLGFEYGFAHRTFLVAIGDAIHNQPPFRVEDLRILNEVSQAQQGTAFVGFISIGDSRAHQFATDIGFDPKLVVWEIEQAAEQIGIIGDHVSSQIETLSRRQITPNTPTGLFSQTLSAAAAGNFQEWVDPYEDEEEVDTP